MAIPLREQQLFGFIETQRTRCYIESVAHFTDRHLCLSRLHNLSLILAFIFDHPGVRIIDTMKAQVYVVGTLRQLKVYVTYTSVMQHVA